MTPEGREDPTGVEAAREAAAQAALRAARRAEYAARTQELTDRFNAEIEEMKARHKTERDGLLGEVERAFAALRAEFAEWV